MNNISGTDHAMAAPGAVAIKIILLAGCAAATVDLVYISTFSYFYSGVMPERILQAIASGILGRDAFNGGVGVAALGFAAHYFILIVAATLFWAAMRHTGIGKISFFTQHVLLTGVLYGLAIYLFMNYVVLPLSAAPKFKSTTFGATCNFAAHLLLIGPAMTWVLTGALGRIGKRPSSLQT